MKKLFAASCVCFALAFVGCIDREFDLAETQGEITVGGDELVVPLGEIGNITLAEIIGDNELIKPNENGVYQITYSSFGEDPKKYESLSIDGISIPNITGLSPKLDPIEFSFQQLPSTLTMRGFNEKFKVDFPTINNLMDVNPISASNEIAVSNLPTGLVGQGSLSDFIASMAPALSLNGGDAIAFNAEISILEELKKIDYVEFGCDKHPFGAPFEIKIDLNGLTDINGGGTANFNMEFPEGYYLRDENGKDLPEASHNKLSKEITISKKQKVVTLLFYLNKIDYSHHTFQDGKLKINDEISYSYDISVTLCGGNYNLDAKPKFSLQSAPEYKDIEVVINHFDLPNAEYELNYSFEGIPNGISVEKIAFKQSPFKLTMQGLEWIEVLCRDTDQVFSPSIEIELPKFLQFEPHKLLDSNTNTLMATAKELAAGVVLKLAGIDCKTNGITIGNGSISVAGSLKAKVHLEGLDNHTILVSTLVPPTSPLYVTVAVEDLSLELDKDNTIVTWNEDQNFDLNLGDQVPAISQTIEIPEMIAEIKRIEIGKANSNDPLALRFKLDAGKSFPVKELDIDLSINLGKLLRPTQATLESGIIRKNESGDYILAIKESWQPQQKALEKCIEFDALENIPDIKNGKLTISQSFPVSGGVKIKSGENIDLSKADGTSIDIDVHIDDIEVRSFTGKVDLSVKPETMFVDLSDLGKMDFDINALSLNPVLKINLKDNPTGVGFNASVAVKTYDSEGNTLSTISLSSIAVNGNGPTNLVISTPRNADKYSGDGITFVAIEGLADILSKGIPAKIGVDMEVASNKDEEITLDLKKTAKGFNIEYQYEAILPFEFDGDIDLSYETTVSGLNATFAEVANTTDAAKVGDVGLIAEFNSTIPFNLVISAELVNAEGTTEGVSARLNINDCVIKGYNKDKDGEYSTSKIDLDFDLGESGSLKGLENADGVRLKISLYGTDADVATLAGTQFINGKLKLRVRDGLTVDVFDFLKGEEE